MLTQEITLNEVRAALRAAVVDGLDVRLQGDPPWSLRREVDAAVARFGAVPIPGTDQLVFPHDPRTLLAGFLSGEPLPAWPPVEDVAAGCMPLPLGLAWPLVNGFSGVAEGSRERILVAWAGSGALVPALVDLNPTARITALEPDPSLAARLVGLPNVEVLPTTLEDYLEQDGLPYFDTVAMNAPFLGPARACWAEAIFRGSLLLALGGRLMAVGPSDVGRHPRYWRDRELLALIAKHEGRVDDLGEWFDVELPSVVVTLEADELRGRPASRRFGRRSAGRQREALRRPTPAAPSRSRRVPVRVEVQKPQRRQQQLDLFASLGGDEGKPAAPVAAAAARPRTWHDVTDDELREVLRKATLRGLDLKLPPRQLDRPVFEAFHELMRLLGGRWVSGTRVHRFKEDAGQALTAFADGGPRPLAARVSEGFVPTPPWLARELVTRDVRLDECIGAPRVLEPSMGFGVIVEAILACRPDAIVTGVEPNETRVKRFAPDPRVSVVASTFEAFAAQAGDRRYDRVVMNPPFAVPTDGGLWLTHVLTAWRLVARGGWLACVAPVTFASRGSRRHDEVRNLVEEHGSWRLLPEDAFPMRTGVLALRKPVA